eukprot:SAG11_NODE_22489_length_405_cov_0.843137_1_plen_120_part_10
MDYCTATKACERMETMVEMRRPFFLGVGLIRPHLPFVVPEDMWKKYSESDIKLPGSVRPANGPCAACPLPWHRCAGSGHVLRLGWMHRFSRRSIHPSTTSISRSTIRYSRGIGLSVPLGT